MGLIEDLRKELDEYEKEYVETDIVDFRILNGGTVLNEGEIFTFRVRVQNQSHLDMRDVSVRINATQYTYVGRPDAAHSYVDSYPFNLDAHQVYHTRYYFGWAIRVTEGGAQDIVTAQILAWDASFEHILNDHTGSGPREGKLHMVIAPD